MLYILLWIVHIMVCLFLIIVVLLQSGKAADLAGAFGGMSQTAFGPRGSATLLSKATTISAVLFMVTSLSLSILSTKNAGLGTTVLESAPRSGTPARPAPAPAPAQQKGVTSTPLPMPPTDNSQQKGAPAPAAPAKK
jgi:preprotein translocase subunit SecG